jgi:predicted PurR-regulated permease PerM
MNRTIVILSLVMIGLGFLIWFFFNIFVYLTISLVLATLLGPLVNNISRFELLGGSIPRVLAVILAYSLVVLVFSLFVLLFIPLISEQIEVLSSINWTGLSEKLLIPAKTAEDFLIQNDLTDNPPGFLVQGFRDGLFDVVQNINFTEIINSLLSITGTFFIGLLAVTFITFFLLYEQGLLKRQVMSLVPNQYFEVFISALYKIEKLLTNYLTGLLFQMLAIFSIVATGLSLFGINYALTIAVFAAVANLIPYLGPILGASFGIAVGLSTSGELEFSQPTLLMAVKILSVFAVVQATDNLVLQPIIFSKSVKAHPLEIFVIIFVGATIAGIPGMIAAIPFYTVLRVSVSEIYEGYNTYKVFRIKN